MVYKWLEPLCPLCRCPAGSDHGLCTVCTADLPWLGHACRRCALPLPTTAGDTCGPCLRRPSPVERTVCALRYEGSVPALVAGFKFHRNLAAGAALATVLATALEEAVATEPIPDALLPVPLHPSRLRRRGYNQAVELAQPLARRWQRPVLKHAVVRQLATADQIGLSALQRRRNLRNAFAVRDAIPNHVAIIDDVLTTGATVLTLAKTLRRAGVERIDVWCLARTV